MSFLVSRAVLGPYKATSGLLRSSVHWRSIAIHSHAQHATALSKIQSKINTASSEFQANAEAMRVTITLLSDQHARIQAGGPAKAREKHLGKGKMLPRE